MDTIDEKSRPQRYRDIARAEKYNEKITAAKGGRRFSHWLETAALKRALKKIGGESALDVPCGTGRIDHLLRARFRRVVGIDSSDAMLKVYLEGGPHREGQQGDIFNLPFPPRSFNWVVCHRLFHHFDNDDSRRRLLTSIAGIASDGLCSTRGSRPRSASATVRAGHTVRLPQVKKLIDDAGLTFESNHYSAWPFQPKAVIVCRKK